MSITEIRNPAGFPADFSGAFSRVGAQRQDAADKASPQEPAQPALPAPEPQGQRGVLTPTEQSFFADLFPGAANEIRGHQAYTNNGQPPRQMAGTLIDRKG